MQPTLYLSRQSHSAIILDSGAYRNDASSYMHSLLTWDHESRQKFRADAKKDLERYGTVDIQSTEVTSVRKTDDGVFEATSNSGQTWAGKKLILATGVKDIYPDIEGYADCWVTGM